jgi:hypothetical protein
MTKTCKKCKVTKSGTVEYTLYASRKVGYFIDVDGGQWHGLVCPSCNAPVKDASNKRSKARIPMLGAEYAPAAPLHSCQECGEKTINRFNCVLCLERMGEGDMPMYNVGGQGG